MPTFSPTQLRHMAETLFSAGGAPPDIAKQVADSLVLSNLVGVDSHGLVRIKNYFDGIKAGVLVPSAQPVVLKDNGVAVSMDGNKAFGQVAARRAMELAVEKARQHAIGAVSFGNVYHIGRLGEWVELAAEQRLIGLMVTNGGRPGGLVAPFGSRQRVLGTNPIAFAIPSGSYPPLVADFSTAAIAEGRVRIAMRKEMQLAEGMIVDAEGHASTTPADLYNGGSILCFGGYKGYALSLLVEVLGGLLSGAETPVFPGYKILQNGVFAIAIEPAFFRPASEYREAVDYLFHAVKEALPAEGFDGVLLPGEPERQRREQRERDGIEVDESTWNEMVELADNLGVAWTA